MSALPAVGSTVSMMVVGPLGQPLDLYQVRVVSHHENEDGVIGPWFSVDNAWVGSACALYEEGIRWTRSDNPVDWQALRAAFALAQNK